MKVEVIKDSIIHDGNIYPTGAVFELDDVIANGLIQNGNVVAFSDIINLEVAEDSQEEHEGKSAHISKETLNEMSYQALKKLAADMGVGANGTKEELIEKIFNVEIEVEDEAIVDEMPADEEGPATGMPEDLA